MQFAIYIFNTPVALKQSQGHQTHNNNVDSKQRYDHANLKGFCFNSIQKEANDKDNFKCGNMSIISLEHV